jgi:hypothetical protein
VKGVDSMALNKNTHTPQTVILTNEVNAKIIQLAKDNHRSVSAQIAYMIEQQLKEDSK